MREKKIACFCLTEPEAGGDLGNVSTLATNPRMGMSLTGSKPGLPMGLSLPLRVLCRTDPGKKLRGLNFFFVPRETPGVSVSKPFDLLGTRTTPICELALTDVKVPRESMLCPEGRGTDNLLAILAEIGSMTATLRIGLVRLRFTTACRRP